MRRAPAFLGLLAALAAAGCGLGAGEGADGVSVVVTRDYGDRALGTARAAEVPGGETVMRFLQRRFRVGTRFSGGFVQSIDGVSGGVEAGRRLDWFYYVNGIEAGKGAAATRLHGGDRVWWDRHDWGEAMGVPAVVGSFPEPFRSGQDGRRMPVTVACTDEAGPACRETEDRLAAAGAKVGLGAISSPPGEEKLRVLVGPWAQVRADPVARRIERGPRTSGVFARFDETGSRLTVLDDRGRTTHTLGAGSGLVAATRLREQGPTWVVTGTDTGGTMSAARALTERALRNRFALALDRGREVAVP